MKTGLREPNKPLRMLHSYVDHFPTGHEQGDFLTIDFGGSNMRVLHVKLIGNRKMDQSGHKWTIPEDVKRNCTAKHLFSWIAGRVLEVQEKNKSIQFSNRIGFCFSFPMHQISLNSATLLQWNKGFNIPDCIGQDVAVMLNNAFADNGSPFKVGAIINDTVAVLLARSYESSDCMIGAVLGTGFNAAYWEDWSAVPKLAPDLYAAKMRTIVNTEIGGLPLKHENSVDSQVDLTSENPGRQCLEKRVSGIYLGRMFEIGCALSSIQQSDYSTKTMSQTEERQLNGWELASSISQRSVQYVACSLAAISNRIGGKEMEIAMEGAVIERYYNYQERLIKVLADVFDIQNIKIAIVDDYSAIGAAVAASMAM